MAIFNAGTQARHSAINAYMRSRIKAPHVYSQVSTLGGVNRAAVMLRVSLDPKSKWANGIFENSRYAMWHLDRDGTLEQFQVSYKIRGKKMRKQKATSLPDAVARINKWIKLVK